MRNVVYEKLRDHEKTTGRNLPYMIVDNDGGNRAELIAELLDVLDTDPRSAAHFLLEQMVLMHRVADSIYIGSAEWENVDNVDELVDNMSSLADDYMFTAGYLLDMA